MPEKDRHANAGEPLQGSRQDLLPSLHLAWSAGDEQVAAVGQFLAGLARVNKVVQSLQFVCLQEPVRN